MSNVLRQGKVFIQYAFAGEIRDTDEGYEFEYDINYLNSDNPRAVSLTMPLRKEKYTSKYLFPFFDGLIPEGWLLNVVVKNWKLDVKDRFGLMIVSCKDCVGDVHIETE